MSEHQHAQRLIDELDRVEKQIRDERVRMPGWRDAFVAFVAAFDTGPVSELLQSRRRLRALELQRDRLTNTPPPATPPAE